MGPDEKDGYVDGEDPEHEDEHRMRVIVKIVVGAGSLSDVRLLAFYDEVYTKLTVSRTKRSARVHVDNCTRTASK